MTEPRPRDPPLDRVDLFRKADFDLGRLRVHPARAQVCRVDGGCQDVEPRIMQVLVALADRRGEIVSRDALIDLCWNGRIVGDDAINRCIVAVRRLARETDPPAFEIETIARVGYCMIAPAQIGEGERAAPARRRTLLSVGAGLLFAGGIAAWLAGRPETSGPPRLQLAAIQSAAPELAVSLREELATSFETDDAIMLVSTNRATEGTPPTLAIGGTIQRTDDVQQFTMHLRNVRSGALIWSQRIELPVSFRLAPRQVAATVSQVMRCALVGAGPYLPRMTDAQLSRWLRLCGDQPMSGEARLDAARKMIAAAPEFAGGWTMLAMLALPIGPRAAEREHLRDEGMRATERALKLDAENGYAHLSMAYAAGTDRSLADREALLKKAIGFRPTDSGIERIAYGDFLMTVGRSRDALKQYRRAFDMQPLGLDAVEGMADGLCFEGRGDEGHRLLANSRALWPNDRGMLTALVRTAFWTKRYDDALHALERPSATLFAEPIRAALQPAFLALKSGDQAKRARAVARLTQLSERGEGGGRILPIALAALRADATAIAGAERAHATVGDSLFSPSFAHARRLPEFAALMQRRGLIAYWRETGSRPDFCAADDAPSMCNGLTRRTAP